MVVEFVLMHLLTSRCEGMGDGQPMGHGCRCPARWLVMLMAAAVTAGCNSTPPSMDTAAPLASDCLAQFALNTVAPEAHLQICEAVVTHYPLLLRAHLDRSIVLQEYEREAEACATLAAVQRNHEALMATAVDLDDLAFYVEAMCQRQVKVAAAE